MNDSQRTFYTEEVFPYLHTWRKSDWHAVPGKSGAAVRRVEEAWRQ